MPCVMPQLILASASPRRRELLDEAGYTYEVRPPAEAAEDEPRAGEAPPALVQRLALQKARDVASRAAPADRAKIVVACDTVAACRGEILGKPRDLADARRMLAMLSGERHEVYSGLCLWPLDGRVRQEGLAVSTLRMEPLDEAAIDAYLASGLWQGKAGAFGYQDELDWIHLESGSAANVVGLPLELLAELLARLPPGGGANASPCFQL